MYGTRSTVHPWQRFFQTARILPSEWSDREFLSILYLKSEGCDLIFADKLNSLDLIAHLCKATLSDERLSTVETPKRRPFPDQLQSRTWVPGPDDGGRLSTKIHWGQVYWDGRIPMNKQISWRGSSKWYPISIADQRDICQCMICA